MSLQTELEYLKVAAGALPDEAHVSDVLSLVDRGDPYDRLFFSTVRDVAWLPILESKGYFSNIPSASLATEERQTASPHLPLVTLTHLAPVAPRAVTAVLSRIALPNNRTVSDQVLQCMALIHDPTCVPQLRPLLAQLVENPRRTSWLWLRELLNTWVELAAFEDILFVTEPFLIAAVESAYSGPRDPDAWLTGQIDEKILGPLTGKYPEEIGKIVFKALCRWAELQRQNYKPSDLEADSPFSYWLEDFKTPVKPWRELEGLLAARLYVACTEIFKGENLRRINQLDDLLRSNAWQLFRRLRLQLYADFPKFTLDRVRSDLLGRLPSLSRLDFIHDYETAQALSIHARRSGDAFLSPEEVKTYFTIVSAGPLEKDGSRVAHYNKDVFHRKQLWPISALLRGKELAAYRMLVPNDAEIDLESYKPVRMTGGSYELIPVAPPEAENLASMEENSLWNLLNTWSPATHFSIESHKREDIGVLGRKFTELVRSRPDRFNPINKWWEKIVRPGIIQQVFSDATDHFIRKQNDVHNTVPPPTENEWRNWFGIANYIIMMHARTNSDNSSGVDKEQGWRWSLKSVADFYRMALKSPYSIPDEYLLNLQSCFQSLLRDVDSRDDRGMKIIDWLSIAINTVEGGVIEALMNLAFRQKKTGNSIEPWILTLIQTRLKRVEASPGIFALLGANLRFFVYLFAEQVNDLPDLLFPTSRPLHQRAAIVSHFCYDIPVPTMLQTFPNLLNIALKTLKSIEDETQSRDANQRDEFGSRLGTQIAFYYWNSTFTSEFNGEATLDRFFAIASAKARATVISQIGSIFEKPSQNAHDMQLISKVMRIWDRRYQQILVDIESSDYSGNNYEGELFEFIEWLNCECFPFEWRLTYAKAAIERLKTGHHWYRILKTISTFSENPNRLDAALQLLRAILTRQNEDLRWSIKFDEFGPVIARGLASENPITKRCSEDCRDLLLKLGLFDFLEVDRMQPK